MTAQQIPTWDDSGQGDLLALVAMGSPATPAADEEWKSFVDALQLASQLDCGPIFPNRLRPMCPGCGLIVVHPEVFTPGVHRYADTLGGHADRHTLVTEAAERAVRG